MANEPCPICGYDRENLEWHVFINHFEPANVGTYICWCGLEVGLGGREVDDHERHLIDSGGVFVHYHASMIGAKTNG